MLALADFLIATEILEENWDVLSEVLELMAQHELFLRSYKCVFGDLQIDYLGYLVSGKGIQIVKRTRAILIYPVPKISKEVQQFLGLLSFFSEVYSQFLVDIGTTVRFFEEGS